MGPQAALFSECLVSVLTKSVEDMEDKEGGSRGPSKNPNGFSKRCDCLEMVTGMVTLHSAARRGGCCKVMERGEGGPTVRCFRSSN